MTENQDQGETPLQWESDAKSKQKLGKATLSVIVMSHAYRAFIEDATNPTFVVGDDGGIRLSNPAAEVMFGYGRNAMLGVHYSELLPYSLIVSDQGFRTNLHTYHRPVDVWREPNPKGRRLDGTEFLVRLSSRPLSSGPGIEISALAMDALSRQVED